MKVKVLIGFLIACFNVSAHQTDISTAILKQKNNDGWVIQINASLTALQHEIKTHFGENAYSSKEEFQQLVIDHMRSNIAIYFNDDHIALKNAYVKLGHSTSIVFELTHIPNEIEKISVTNESFKNIIRNQCAFGIVKNGSSSDQYILNDSNNHTAVLMIQGKQFVHVGDMAKMGNSQPYIILGISASILVLGAFYIKKSKIKFSIQEYTGLLKNKLSGWIISFFFLK